MPWVTLVPSYAATAFHHRRAACLKCWGEAGPSEGSWFLRKVDFAPSPGDGADGTFLRRGRTVGAYCTCDRNCCSDPFAWVALRALGRARTSAITNAQRRKAARVPGSVACRALLAAPVVVTRQFRRTVETSHAFIASGVLVGRYRRGALRPKRHCRHGSQYRVGSLR